MAGDDCELSPKRVRTVNDASSQLPERVCTSADDLGNDHLSENAGQNTAVPAIQEIQVAFKSSALHKEPH